MFDKVRKDIAHYKTEFTARAGFYPTVSWLAKKAGVSRILVVLLNKRTNQNFESVSVSGMKINRELYKTLEKISAEMEVDIKTALSIFTHRFIWNLHDKSNVPPILYTYKQVV